ncbi:MAG: dihydroneopterin aldolase [Bacteroidales bacterium]|jgi:dihydroneopterin aldolase|nr:dihydroneopterin aldolase [Bacteroidales bacterium]
MGTIQLEGMEFFAFHGCFKEEQIIGTKFILDLEVESDTNVAEVSDRLQDTVDYAGIYRKVKHEMGMKSHLLEHVARRIVESIRSAYPSIVYISLKIAKNNPPLGGKIHQVCYKTRWKK